MDLFKQVKDNKYIENMKNSTKAQLSLLNTLTELQSEYEKSFNEHQEELQKVMKENAQLKAELFKLKGK